MKITKEVSYIVDECRFKSLEGAVQATEDALGRFVDRMLNSGHFGPKDRLHIHRFLLDNRKEVINLLTIEYPEEDE